MKVVDVIQGSPEWLALRTGKFTASEAPAMMGVSKYQSRSDLLKQKYSGEVNEPTPAQQKIFARGHAAEAAARPIAEEIIGEELYPCTALWDENDGILASFDGVTMLEDVVWEHKLINAQLRNTTVETLPDHYKAQMDQQLLVSGAEKCLLMASDGTRDDMVHFWYERDEERIRQVVAGWIQFQRDLDEYQPKQQTVDAVGESPDSLPVLTIELTGAVTASNLPKFKERALAMIKEIKTELSTDQDFADADSTVKFLKKGEKQLDDSKSAALQQTATISDLFTTIDELKEQMRQKRLQLEKLVKAEKENRRNDIRMNAENAFSDWLYQQGSPIAFQPDIDISSAMKGKKTISSLQAAADDEVARAKIEATRTIEAIKSNNKLLTEQSQDYEFLFSDRERLLIKSPDDLAATIKARIGDHKEREEQRLQEDRERIKEQAQESPKDATQKPERQPVDTSRINAAAQRYERKQDDTVTISRKEYDDLVDASLMLQALEMGGVDNWQWYSEAVQQFEQLKAERAA